MGMDEPNILEFFGLIEERTSDVPPPEVPHGVAPWSKEAQEPRPPWDGGPAWSKPKARDPLVIEEGASVAQARAALYQRTHIEGIPCACPVCDHWDEVYARRFHCEAAQFVQSLVTLYRAKPGWFHMRDIVPGGPKHSSDGPYLGLHYGLVERMSNTDERPSQGRSTGFYRPTRHASDFVDGQLWIPEFVLVSNRGNQAVGWSPDRIDIHKALGIQVPAPAAAGG